MTGKEIKEELLRRQDLSYRAFQKKLLPTVAEPSIIGVRTPELRKLAKILATQEETDTFLGDLPHSYFDENQLHAFILSAEKDFDRCILQIQRFLPYVDNWATCDQMSPKVFRKHRTALLPYLETWIHSDKPYTVRFAIGMLMQHFLEDAFDLRYPRMVADVSSSEYYVNMMRAWYFATALAKQYPAVLSFLEKNMLDRWTHNKTIQKSLESCRIAPEQKQYLRSLKIPAKETPTKDI